MRVRPGQRDSLPRALRCERRRRLAATMRAASRSSPPSPVTNPSSLTLSQRIAPVSRTRAAASHAVDANTPARVRWPSAVLFTAPGIPLESTLRYVVSSASRATSMPKRVTTGRRISRPPFGLHTASDGRTGQQSCSRVGETGNQRNGPHQVLITQRRVHPDLVASRSTSRCEERRRSKMSVDRPCQSDRWDRNCLEPRRVRFSRAHRDHPRPECRLTRFHRHDSARKAPSAEPPTNI